MSNLEIERRKYGQLPESHGWWDAPLVMGSDYEVGRVIPYEAYGLAQIRGQVILAEHARLALAPSQSGGKVEP